MTKAPIKIGISVKILALIILILVLALLVWNYWQTKVYLVDSITGAPITDRYVEVVYRPFCAASSCNQDNIVFSGKTQMDGSVSLRLRNAVAINVVVPAFDPKYEYWINTDGYNRDLSRQVDESSRVIYLMPGDIKLSPLEHLR